MNREFYPLIGDITRTRYDFFSKGPKGVIWKTIEFKDIGASNFNVCFGDWNESLKKIDDRSRTNNHDRDKILNTIARAVFQFLECFPGACVIAEGSTPSRTRLYQMAIKANLPAISALLYVYGYLNGEWHRVEKEINYQVFMASKRRIFNFNR